MAASNSNQNKNDTLLDALNKGIKFVYRIVREIIRVLGFIFIDKLMRAVVSWYDKAHKKEPSFVGTPDENLQKEIQWLRSQLNTVNGELSKENSQNSLLIKELDEAKTRIVTMSSEIDEQKEKIQSLNSQIDLINSQDDRYKALIKSLEEERDELVKHSVSPDIIPSTIVYAEGDASSTNMRKLNINRQPASLYEIHTLPGNYSEGVFYVLTPNNSSLIIENRSVALRACHIDYVEVHANTIQTLKPGRVRKKGKEWELIEAAIIKLIKQ